MTDNNYYPKERAYTGGSFNVEHHTQMKRLKEISGKIRGKKVYFAKVLPEDPHEIKDHEGNTYFGSYRHLMEFTIRILERMYANLDS